MDQQHQLSLFLVVPNTATAVGFSNTADTASQITTGTQWQRFSWRAKSTRRGGERRTIHAIQAKGIFGLILLFIDPEIVLDLTG